MTGTEGSETSSRTVSEPERRHEPPSSAVHEEDLDGPSESFLGGGLGWVEFGAASSSEKMVTSSSLKTLRYREATYSSRRSRHSFSRHSVKPVGRDRKSA